MRQTQIHEGRHRLDLKSKSRINSKKLTKTQTEPRVCWALDLNEKKFGHLEKMAEAVRLWNPHEKSLFPVSILSPLDLGWPMEITRGLRANLMAQARYRSSQQFSLLPFRRETAEILIAPRISLLSSVRKLIQFASRHKAEILVLYSRQSGENHLTGLGSFTELTITSSNLPVMILGQHTKVPQKISKILFPTDFSFHRRKSFRLAMEWARRFDAELILYHQLPSPLTPIAMMSLDAPMDAALMEAAWKAQRESEREKGAQWVREAQKNGVNCRIILEMSSASWSQRALETIQAQKADLIIISHRRGKWGQALFGGQIRRLFSKSRCPLVLVRST